VGRIQLVDAVRGFALLNIFVNHLSLSVFSAISPSVLGFSDSAEIFVFLSGVACYLAYAPGPGGAFARVRERMWSRAVRLYLVNAIIILASLAAALLAIRGGILPETLPDRELFADRPLAALWNALTFRQSVGYSMVLRLYFFLLLIGPLYVWLASRRLVSACAGRGDLVRGRDAASLGA